MTTPTAPTRTLVVERDLPHPPEKIWRALTQASLMEAWLLSNDFQPVLGHRFTLRAPPMPQWNGEIACAVLVLDAPRRLSYSWTALGLETVVTWTLTPRAGGTHLRLEQAGFRSETDANYRGATYGWQKFLGNLERVVAELNWP